MNERDLLRRKLQNGSHSISIDAGDDATFVLLWRGLAVAVAVCRVKRLIRVVLFLQLLLPVEGFSALGFETAYSIGDFGIAPVIQDTVFGGAVLLRVRKRFPMLAIGGIVASAKFHDAALFEEKELAIGGKLCFDFGFSVNGTTYSLVSEMSVLSTHKYGLPFVYWGPQLAMRMTF